MVARLQFEDAAPVILYAPADRVATATWELHDLRYPASSSDYLLSSGSGVLDTFSESLGADAGPGEADPSLLTLGVTTGLVIDTLDHEKGANPASYYLSDDHGAEIVAIAGLTASTNAKTAHPAIGSYTTGRSGQLRGLVFTATIPASVAADEQRLQNDDPLRMVWVHPDGTKHQQQVRLLRDDHSDLELAAVQTSILDLFPDVGTRVQHQGKTVLPRMISSQARQLEASERARGEEPTLKLGGDERHWALVWKVLLHLAAMGMQPGQPDDPTVWVEHCREEFNTYWHGSTTGPGGRETARMSRETGEASGPTDQRYMGTIHGL